MENSYFIHDLFFREPKVIYYYKVPLKNPTAHDGEHFLQQAGITDVFKPPAWKESVDPEDSRHVMHIFTIPLHLYESVTSKHRSQSPPSD